ncbi:AT-rich interactive domain-containing protein 1-like isoform X1 [Chenopodium quinoa]|uniref:AT-rich interactive domain-containing protein 1-like isoform X1 n=2 Tax=Chenopodium quinoa TaxID=63459 RepID=UPI000B76E5DA|nr:AT-rich interactive domain-containing protein 1-like isoform X1 [Chenopodium quinoa]XP_021767107.1 AT-rich interactive domain-containing protein 1-like isoform X1 [Chenopodium quinoa]
MAGWSKLGGCKSVQTLESCNKGLKSDENELRSSFVDLISDFLEESCSTECFRPLPPMLGDGHAVDLLKLYFVVKLKGGFEAISKKRLWDEVGLLYGLGPGIGSALKLIYLKYLDCLESWLGKLSSVESSKNERFCSGVWSKGVMMALGSEYSSFVSNIMDEMRKSDDTYSLKEKSEVTFIDLTEDEENENENDKSNWNKFVRSFGDDGDSTQENEDTSNFKQDVEMGFSDGVGFTGENNDKENFKETKSEMSYAGVFSSDGSDDGRSSVDTVVVDNVVKSSENSCDSKKGSTDDEELLMDSSVLKEVSSLKRKRDSMSDMLCWIAKVAKHPTDPEIGTIPESSKWASYGNDNCWKQVLLAREALFLRRSAEQSAFQKRQKMHPSMFDDNEGPRFSPRLLLPNSPPIVPSSTNQGRPRQRLEARLDMKPTASIYKSRPQQRIPLGEEFQVQVPEWTGVVGECDSKWLGTRDWPLENRSNNVSIETYPVGKGRSDNCGCLFPGTVECVKFHVAKRRMEMKFELGSAFYTWKFDKMGEDCSVSWTAEEEKKFKYVVKENPLSHQKCFWKQMLEVLPKKSWVDQVNYYFNVFVLRRRAFQNRSTPKNIDSDDDETEYVLARMATNTLRHDTASRI